MDFARPGFSDPLELLARDRSRFPALSYYIPALESRFRSSRMVHILGRASLIVEPTDRTLGKDARLPKGRAFYCGGLIGIRILSSCTTESVRAAALDVELGLPASLLKGDDPLSDEHDYADTLVNNSEHGLTLFPDIANIISNWQTEHTQDITIQPFLSRGAGLLLYAMHEANEVVLGREMELAVADPSGIDWDAGLRDLTAGDGIS